MALYQLEIDPAVQMKSSVQQIREGDGKGTVDPDASEIEVWLCPVAVSNVLKMSKVEASKMYKYIFFFMPWKSLDFHSASHVDCQATSEANPSEAPEAREEGPAKSLD